MHSAAGVLHAGAVHALAFEDIEVHFAEPIGEDYADELRVFEPVIFLFEEVTGAILIGPPGAEDVGHADGQGACLVLEEGLLYSQVETVIGFDIALRRTLRRRVWRPELVGAEVYGQLGLRLVDRGELNGEADRQLEIAVEFTEIAEDRRLGDLFEVVGIDMRVIHVDVEGDVPPFG